MMKVFLILGSGPSVSRSIAKAKELWDGVQVLQVSYADKSRKVEAKDYLKRHFAESKSFRGGEFSQEILKEEFLKGGRICKLVWRLRFGRMRVECLRG